jgi:MFS family permease
MSSATRLLLAGLLAMALVMGIGRFYYTPMLPLMQRDYGFDAAMAGLIASANFAGYLVGSIAASFIRPGPTRMWIFRLSILASVVTTASMGLTDNTTVWIVLRTASGIASALAMICSAMVISEALFAVNEPGRISWIFVGVGGGIALSGLIAHFAGGSLSSAQMWYLAGGLSALMVPFIFAEMRDRELEPRPHKVHAKARQPRPLPFAALLVNYTCEGLGYSVFATFIVAIVKDAPGAEAFADWVWVITGVAGAFSILMWAAVAGRIGYAAALTAAYVLQVVGTALPAFNGSGVVAIIAAAMFGGTFMGVTMLTLAVGRQSVDGRGIAILTAGFGLGQMIGPAVAGYMVTAGFSYSDALIGSAGILLFGLAVLVIAVALRNSGLLPGKEPAP